MESGIGKMQKGQEEQCATFTAIILPHTVTHTNRERERSSLQRR